MTTKTIYRNARTKRLCKKSDPEAEALTVVAKRLRRIGDRLYRFEAGRRYAIEDGQPYELVRTDRNGQLRAEPLKPVSMHNPDSVPLFD